MNRAMTANRVIFSIYARNAASYKHVTSFFYRTCVSTNVNQVFKTSDPYYEGSLFKTIISHVHLRMPVLVHQAIPRFRTHIQFEKIYMTYNVFKFNVANSRKIKSFLCNGSCF